TCSRSSSESKEISSSNEFSNTSELDGSSKDSSSLEESRSTEENSNSSESNKTTKQQNISTPSIVITEITTEHARETTAAPCFTSSVELQNLIYEINLNLSVTQQQIHNITILLIECSKDANHIQETIDLVENLSILAHELHFIIHQLENHNSSRTRKLLISMAQVKDTFNLRNGVCGESHNNLETISDILAKALENSRSEPVTSSVKKHLYCTSQHFSKIVQHGLHNVRKISRAEESNYQKIIFTKLLPNIDLTMKHMKK
ncbi:unnamed protein product, partial [Meganyctiphanes norvegica]